ncbi:unnamed protein product [Clonostachys rosea f. rosea IK726]|uniref:Heterokaryon incompatibility domain-containing protein n=2 Tax=Bionectria ochroleuca TaxID=29856 RepID=A0A0B7K390_BIOOC|nr:unnamed protein product [Clonostachys rosea f. rosea IK726]
MERWHQKYMLAESDGFPFEVLGVGYSELIRDLESDQLDTDAIERRVQQLARKADVSKGFCASCRNLFNHWPALDEKEWDSAVLRYFSTEEVEAFSRAGCKFCDFIMGRFQHHEGLLDRFRKIEARFAGQPRPARCSLAVQNVGDGIGENATSQALWVNLPGKEVSHCNYACDQELADFVSEVLPKDAKLWDEDTESLDLVKTWLSDCDENHKKQCSSRKPQDGPGRLIQTDPVRLVETASLESLPQYATLTYCWGKAPFFKLTQDTYAEFLAGVSLDRLPQTFQDAIIVARRLGLSHIWIDALCIIQEEPDKADWLKESGRMRSVYGGSHVTLAASSATDVSQGFLASALSPKYQGGFYTQVSTDKYTRKQNFHSAGVFFESILQTPLAERAWALGERLLSRRTVQFSEYGVFWQCHATSRSEFIPGGFGGHPGPTLMFADEEPLPWMDVMCQYSETKLTYASDRLPALSGIAARQHEITGDKYLAGLWQKELVPSLLWFSLDNTEMNERGAPSWTWASIDGPCSVKEFTKKGGKPQARLLESWTKLLGPDPFGAVTDGEITLACQSLIPATLDREGPQSLDTGSDSPEAPEAKKVSSVTIHKSSLQPFPVKLDCTEQEAAKNESVYLLPIMAGRVSMYVDEAEEMKCEDPHVEYAGLVLRSVNNIPSHFIRLGIFGFSNQPWEPGVAGRDLYADFSSALEEQGEETAKSVCLETNEDADYPKQRFVIKIK